MFRKNERLCCTIEFHEKEKSQSKKSHITKKKKKSIFNQNFIFPRIEESCVKYFNRGEIDERERKKKK